MSQEKEWDDFPPNMPNLTILPWLLWGLVVGIVIAALFYSARLHAEPRFTTTEGNVVVTLYDDACELTDQIVNIPYKATWQEGGKTFQGCWMARPDAQAALAYFTDKTVALIPFQMLKAAQGA